MKIAVAGCLGRVGKTLVEYIPTTDHALTGGTVRMGQEEKAKELYAMVGVAAPALSDNISIIFDQADAIIDFTRPQHSLAIAAVAAAQNKVHICGTTGFSDIEQEKFSEYASAARIVHAPNMSLGVNLLAALSAQVSGALGVEFDIEIYEMHHRHKVDAPSGTALLLGKAAAEGRGVVLDEAADFGRHGFTGERMPGRIGFAVSRGGDVVGDHMVTFAGPGERIELTHRASSRMIYARGAVRAAEWAAGQIPGLYDMQDVLGLR